MKKSFLFYLLLGIAGAAGVGLGYSVIKKTKKHSEPELDAAPVKPDTPPGMIACPDCGNKFKEYELFCPYCRRTVEPDATLAR